MGKIIKFIPNVQMEKIKFKLSEIIALEAEINGTVDLRTGQLIKKGLMSQPMTGARKYWLKKLSDTLAKEAKTLDELKEELIKKYGEEDEKLGMSIKKFLDDNGTKVNPNHTKYEEEMREMLETEVEIEYNPIKLSELSEIKFEEFYYHIFSLVEE
jgi:hypothetical protein